VQARRGFIRAECGRLADAESDFRAVLEFEDGLPPKLKLPGYMGRWIQVRSALGNLLWATGRRQEASALFRQAEQEARRDNDRGWHNAVLAWLLATCPDEHVRNPTEAVALAEKAVKMSPPAGSFGRTLGVARYRAGDARGAVAALEKSLELGPTGLFRSPRGDSSEWFFLAMAHWHLGDKEQARKWYDQAVRWTEKNRPRDPELLRFREEAAEVLGVKNQPAPHGEEAPPRKE
jgi:tetratricopeptide (TPR) repeat protein